MRFWGLLLTATPNPSSSSCPYFTGVRGRGVLRSSPRGGLRSLLKRTLGMETRPFPHPIRLLTYLSPGLPLAIFGAVADHLRRWPGLGGPPITLASEERVSG